MNKTVIGIAITLFLSGNANIFAYDTIKYVRKGYILNLVNKDKTLDERALNNLIDTYFIVYPVLVRNFNEEAVREVAFFIDPDYSGIAESGGGKIRINPKWLKDHSDDFDIITHEVMHLVQDYPPGTGPWWITEGIADYVRYVYGVDNEKGGWYLPDYSEDQNYDNGYRVTARFFLWIENRIRPGFIKQLDHVMRANIYSEGFWGRQTGMTLQELWDVYGKNPAI
ncbi:MAG: basic secretory family protein [Cytophagales bacterium]|nr:basic secretory family protein [Cytophagales bacterium]